MIKIIEAPQRSDHKISYIIEGDTIAITVDGQVEVFDFSGFPEGSAEEIISEQLPILPIIQADKIADEVTLRILRFYGVDEKENLKMSKIMWTSKKDKDAKKAEQEKFKGKDFKNLSSKEKDEILERIARQLGII